MHTKGIVPLILPGHIVAGGLALVFGYVALSAAKGATIHRKSGMLFVYAMLAMSLTGAFVAVLTTSSVSVVAGLLTFYLVTTGMLTVRRRAQQTRWTDRLAMLFALTLGVAAFAAAIGDARMMRAGGIQGPRRLSRHVWRMCFAMWVAAASFLWGPAGRVPEVIRIPALLAGAVLLPIAVMLYWLWRLRRSRTHPRTIRVGAPQPTA